MKIRLATRSDASAVANVIFQSFLEYKSSYTDEAFAATTPTSTEVQHRLAEGPVWIAVEDETVVGTVSAVPEGEALHIRSLAVLPTSRGKGAGELLLRQTETHAHEKGYSRLLLSTTPFLTPAIRLYERFGFRRFDEGPKDRLGTPIFTMAKPIKPKHSHMKRKPRIFSAETDFMSIEAQRR
jgi:ribosomal protein S18 acetylase RimI-like enzyme